MCVSLESCYHDFVTLFAGRYRNHNRVVISSLSINIVYVMLRNSYCVNCRSPIVHGVMEISCKVTVKIPGTCVNILLMEKYKLLVQQLYIETKNEEILWSSLQENQTIDGVEAQPVSKKAKVKRKQTYKTVNRQKDIRHFLRDKES